MTQTSKYYLWTNQADRFYTIFISTDAWLNVCRTCPTRHVQVPKKQVNRTQSSTLEQIASHLLLHDLNFERSKCHGFSLMIRCLVVKAYSNFLSVGTVAFSLGHHTKLKTPTINWYCICFRERSHLFNLPKRWYDYNEQKIDLFCENEFASATITHQIPESPTDKSTATADCQSSAVENAMDFVSRRFLKSSGCLCLKKISDIFIFLDLLLKIPSILMVLVHLLTMFNF